MRKFRKKKPTGSASARLAAWRAQGAIATRAPFSSAVGGPDLDEACLVGQSVEDSKAIHDALLRLLPEVPPPEDDLLRTTMAAQLAMVPLVRLRPSWVTHCDALHTTVPARMGPDEAEKYRAMCREFPDTETVLSWPHYLKAQEAMEAAIGPLDILQHALARFCGSDMTALVRARSAVA